MRNDSIIIIDDYKDDLVLLGEIIKEIEIPNPIRSFNDPLSALNYLKYHH